MTHHRSGTVTMAIEPLLVSCSLERIPRRLILPQQQEHRDLGQRIIGAACVGRGERGAQAQRTGGITLVETQSYRPAQRKQVFRVPLPVGQERVARVIDAIQVE
jgi:hypothetical protein